MSGGRRVGLFGGTFDPIHAGHLGLAATGRRELDLSEVRFLVNRNPPHKSGPRVSGADRLAMVALAAAGDAGLVPDGRELERQGPSYTVHTVEDVQREMPDARLYFLAGADSLHDLPSWHRWEELLERAVFVAVARDGFDLDAALAAAPPALPRAVDRGRVVLLHAAPPPWSSTELRRSLSAGVAPEGALVPAVAEYVTKCGLYRDAEESLR